MKKKTIFMLFLLILPIVGHCEDEYVSLDWKSEIGNDLYQDITKIDNNIYVLSKKAIYKYNLDGNRIEIPLELCDMGSFSENSVICYNFSDNSFRTPHSNNNYNHQKEYIYEYDLNGKIVNKIMVWNGTVPSYRVGRGFDFERVSKVDNLYFFFVGHRILGIYDTDGIDIDGAYRYNSDTYDYGYYDENYEWISVDITKYQDKLKDMGDVEYIYEYFYKREFNKYIEKYKSMLEQMRINYTYQDLLYNDDIELPTQALIASSYKNKYYLGYLDSENSTYMALIHDKTTNKDIDLKINGNLFFSVILGDDYFILLDSDKTTCNTNECKKTHIKKYDYNGNVIEEEDILTEDDSFMGTSVGYVTDGGFVVVAGNKPSGKTEYTTSLIRFNKPNKKVDKKVTGKGNVNIDKSNATAGEKIVFGVSPDKNYVVDYIKVADANGNEIEVNDYSFIMPNTDVTVEVVFKLLVNPKTGITNYSLFTFLIIIASSIVYMHFKNKNVSM